MTSVYIKLSRSNTVITVPIWFLLTLGTICLIVFAAALWAAKRVGYQKGIEDTLEEANNRVQGAYQTGMNDGIANEKKRVADCKAVRLVVPEKDNRP